jgi:hypothetical protein
VDPTDGDTIVTFMSWQTEVDFVGQQMFLDPLLDLMLACVRDL